MANVCQIPMSWKSFCVLCVPYVLTHLGIKIFPQGGYNSYMHLRRLKNRKEKESEVAQSCPSLCNPMGCSLPGSSIHEILQAGKLEWVAISFSRRSSQPRDRTQVSHIVGRRFNIWATREEVKG